MARDKGTGVLVAVIALILIGGAVVFFFDAENAGPQQPVSTERTQVPPVTPPQAAAARMNDSLPAAKREALADAGSEQENPYFDRNEAAANADPEQENPYFNREVKARLAQVADAYAEQIQYPSFSMPIPNREALQKYLPNRSIGAERRLDIEDENSPRIRLQTDKQHYFTGDTIKVTVSLSGLTGHPRVEVKARLVTQGQILATADASAADRQAVIYQMSFSHLDSIVDLATDEYRVVARVAVDGKVYELGTPVSYVDSVARVTDVGMAQVSGEYLYIPVNVTTSKPGYHELSANLYAAQSNKPLVHLSVQQELQTSNGLMQLKAHIAALKVGGDPGPYRLQDISLMRMPSPPDFTSEYGKASQDAYPVNGYAFDEYDDLPYVDEEARKRLEFLRQAGKTD
jgi:hypothetical protein